MAAMYLFIINNLRFFNCTMMRV